MRLFFALWPDEATREAIHRATRVVVRRCGGRPVPPDNYHVTLTFLGPVPGERFDGLVAAARGVAAPSFTLTLGRLGYFADAKVLWLGPEAVPVSLQNLHRDIWAAAAKAGVPPDPKPFHPHVTLARKVASAPAPSRLRQLAWPVSGFALVASETDPAGARYRVVHSFACGSGFSRDSSDRG